MLNWRCEVNNFSDFLTMSNFKLSTEEAFRNRVLFCYDRESELIETKFIN